MPSTHTSIHLHLVFSTKHREPWFDRAFLPDLHGYLNGCVTGLEGKPHLIGGVADHVHLLIGLKPTHCLSDFMRELKAVSSGWIKGKLKRDAFAWQTGYGAFSVGAADLPKVKAYILNQEEHHRRQTFQEEYVAMLKRGMVEFDERYLW